LVSGGVIDRSVVMEKGGGGGGETARTSIRTDKFQAFYDT